MRKSEYSLLSLRHQYQMRLTDVHQVAEVLKMQLGSFDRLSIACLSPVRIIIKQCDREYGLGGVLSAPALRVCTKHLPPC